MIGRLAAAIGRISSANRLLSAALLVLTLTGAVGMFKVGNQLADISERIHPGGVEEQRRLRAQLQIDAEVDEVLGRLADDTEADRTLVFLAHNGQTDLTGKIPFMFLSNVHAYLRPGLSWQEAWSRPQPLSGASSILRRIFRDPDKPRCVKVDRGDADISAVLRASMIDRGVELVFVCPLVGPRGVVGMMTAEYLRRDSVNLSQAETLERLHAASLHIHHAMTVAR